MIAAREPGWEERQAARMAAFHASNRAAREGEPGHKPSYWNGKLPPSQLIKPEGEA